jgi:hypothetical protein
LEQSIADLGDLIPGETLEILILLKEICGLMKAKIIPIVIGTQDLTCAIYEVTFDSLQNKWLVIRNRQ